jgi:hypothetical protein
VESHGPSVYQRNPIRHGAASRDGLRGQVFLPSQVGDSEVERVVYDRPNDRCHRLPDPAESKRLMETGGEYIGVRSKAHQVSRSSRVMNFRTQQLEDGASLPEGEAPTIC